MKKTCIQCGEEFEITEGEVAFYEEKDMQIPDRCRRCRKLNRIQNSDPVVKRKRVIQGMPKNIFGNPRTVLMAVLIIAVFVVSGAFDRSHGKKAADNVPGSALSGGAAAGNSLSGEDSGSQHMFAFRNWDLLNEHYEKHGTEMGYLSAETYLSGANKVISNPESLHKKEREDGDDLYFLEETKELVVVSTDGFIRTYFVPKDGIAYYDRQ